MSGLPQTKTPTHTVPPGRSFEGIRMLVGHVENYYTINGDMIMNQTTINCSKSAQHPYENAGLRGLRGKGNRGFLNSVLQCLSNTKPLLECSLSRRRFMVNQNSSTKGELFMTFAQLIRDLWDPAQRKEVDNSKLKCQIQDCCPTFQGTCQHDAQEVLRLLLERLHNDLNRVTEKPDIKSLEIPADDLPDEEKSRLVWDWNLKFDNSQITDIFLGQFKSTLTCLSCGHRSVTFDPFWDLSISIPTSRYVSLQDCLAQFTQEETLTDAEMPKGVAYQCQQSCKKRLCIQAFPDVLVIHLKRFTKDGKLRTVVKFPLENLNLGVYAEPSIDNCSYNLFGICSHIGEDCNAGHYIAYAKHPYSMQWHRYENEKVTPCKHTNVALAQPYLLFYELSLESKRVMDR